jgi:hypothetical protein
MDAIHLRVVGIQTAIFSFQGGAFVIQLRHQGNGGRGRSFWLVHIYSRTFEPWEIRNLRK